MQDYLIAALTKVVDATRYVQLAIVKEALVQHKLDAGECSYEHWLKVKDEFFIAEVAEYEANVALAVAITKAASETN